MKTTTVNSEFCKLSNIGTHFLNNKVKGSGGPTIILEAGGASWSMDWYSVQNEIAKFPTVYSYDSAGLWFSKLSPEPRTAKAITNELQLLLSKEILPKPYIIFAASFGGRIARIFSHLNKKDVLGLNLLVACHEKINDLMLPKCTQFKKKGFARTTLPPDYF
ncbi:MAG: alpha/beta hydrolase [Saprospiraceae bacterium]|nr:alpha/beta hydrolase [Saprospiraceae bacterium]